jgi:hypothetical protein
MPLSHNLLKKRLAYQEQTLSQLRVCLNNSVAKYSNRLLGKIKRGDY